jgi:DNA-binding XRE family transcriptional regulator
MNIGEHIRQARREATLTQSELGELAGIGRQAVIRLEGNGGRVSSLYRVIPYLRFRVVGLSGGQTIHEQIRRARDRRGWTQAVAANRAGVSVPTLRAVERGEGSVAAMSAIIDVLASRAASNSLSKGENLRGRDRHWETFRTPAHATRSLLDYQPEWFAGSGFDPSAGDGRMLHEIVARGNAGPHFANDIRAEDLPAMAAVPGVAATIGDYLAMASPPRADFLLTNPPFTRSVEFVVKARTHVSGAICILQSTQWQATQKRSQWMRKSGLAHVLNLTKRPKWEVDSGPEAPRNIWDYAWFVFLPDYAGLPSMDWLCAA